MNKEFVPYELAVKLKQLGFDKPCFGYYKKTSLGNDSQNLVIQQTEIGFYNVILIPEHTRILAPLFQQAFRWFREKNQLDTSINTVYSKYNDTLSKKYSGVIDDKSVFTNIGFYDTYEEAELACLDKLIEIVETKQQEQ
jgi:hypothetical protein